MEKLREYGPYYLTRAGCLEDVATHSLTQSSTSFERGENSTESDDLHCRVKNKTSPLLFLCSSRSLASSEIASSQKGIELASSR